MSIDARATQIVLRDDAGMTAHFAEDGQLLAIKSDGCVWDLAPGCFGWSLRMGFDDQAPDVLRPCAAARVTQIDATHLHVEFDRMRHEDGREVEVTLRLTWELVDGLLQGRIEHVEMPEGLLPAALAFPDIPLPYSDNAQWVVPRDIGVLIDNPLADAVDAPDMSGFRRERAHMQMTAWVSGESGLYMDSRDTDGWMKSLLLRVGKQTAELCIEHLLPQPVTGQPEFPGQRVSLAPFAGGW